MEVHHPHHLSHKKKWKEYILEFLMLFFAVTLGFVAENYRDVYIEKERAHELIIQLKTDINNNIRLIDSVVKRDKTISLKFDSAMVYLVSNKRINTDSLYKNLPSNIYRFQSKNDIYNQMKSSGSLRYIKDKLLLEKILNYGSACLSAETRSSDMEGDFVMKEYNNAISIWMPKTEAARRYLRDRKGNDNNIGKENSSSLLTNAEAQAYLDQLKDFKEDNLLSFQHSEELKSSLLPVITRRYGLLINTVRFMGRTKDIGLDLLEYIESIEK